MNSLFYTSGKQILRFAQNDTFVHTVAALGSRSALAALLFCLGLAANARAQRTNATAERDSARAAADSMAARLRRAEQAIAALQQQMADQAESGVSTRSRMHLELNGRVLVHAVRNSKRVNNADDPQFVRPDSAGLQSTPFVFTARQTTLGAVVTARDVLGGGFTGDLDVDFYGGQLSGTGGRTFPLVRLRTARGTVRWAHGSVMAGQDVPLIAGVNPVSPAAIGTPLFAGSGNLWLWLPQVRGTLETRGAVRFGVQAAVLANITGDAVGQFDTDVDLAERSGRPALQGRAKVRWGDDERPSEIGCGGHLAWIDLPTIASTRTNTVACDASVALTSQLELRAEAYDGRGLRGLGGGGIGQTLNRFAQPLDDRGGWLQLNGDVNTIVKLGAGCGADLPRESDLAAGGRLRNVSCAGYTIMRPSGPLFVGAEVRGIQTTYAAGSFTNVHLSLALGFEF